MHGNDEEEDNLTTIQHGQSISGNQQQQQPQYTSMLSNYNENFRFLQANDNDVEERCFCRKGGKESSPDESLFISIVSRFLEETLQNHKLGSCERCTFDKDCKSDRCISSVGRCGDPSSDVGLLGIGCPCVEDNDCSNHGGPSSCSFCNSVSSTSNSTTTKSCEIDSDLDGICDRVDNCPAVSNPGQEDVDGNGVGDACELSVCGNRLVEADEECDDGNMEDGDGCDRDCLLEENAVMVSLANHATSLINSLI